MHRIATLSYNNYTEELASEQAKDKELQELLSGESALKLKEFTLPGLTTPLYCDISEGAIRYVPRTLRKKIFDTVHGMAHPSDRATKHQIAQKLVWP